MTDHLLLDEKWNICDGEGNIRGGRLDSVIDNGRIDLFPMGAVGRRLIAVGHLCSVHCARCTIYRSPPRIGARAWIGPC